jgi:hypothetical protein
MAWIGLLLRGSVFFLAFSECHVARRITRGSLSCGMQSLEKGDERRSLWRTQVLSVRRHVAASLDHLAYELVLRQPHGYGIQGRTSLAAEVPKGMAVAALFGLKDERSLAL